MSSPGNAGAGDDFVYGDADNDTLNGGSGNDVLIGGHGRVTIQAGQGDDTVIVLDPCELEAGEVLSGGAGTDTLRIPIPLVEVQALGIAITGFESIIVDPQSEVSECGKCGCTVAEGVLSCCSGEGTCDAEVGDGQIACNCPPSLQGSDCSLDTAQTFYNEGPIPGCQVNDPGCWLTFDADDQCATIDMFASEDCDDFPAIASAKAAAILADLPFEMQYCLWYPAAEGQPGVWADGLFPLWLFNAGNGFDEGDYSGLLAHLARNGIVSVAMSNSTNSAPISLRGEMLACLRRRAPELVAGDHALTEKLNNLMAYGGHSRGGEAAVVATRLDLDSLEMLPTEAVVTLAPTSVCLGHYSAKDCGYPNGSEEAQRAALVDGSTRGSLYDAPDYRPFFTGAVQPECIADPPSCGIAEEIPVFPQFREGGTEQGGFRQTVRYFSVPFEQEEGTGSVTPGPGLVQVPSEAAGQRESLRGESVAMSVAASPWIEVRLDGFEEPSAPLDSLGSSLSVLSFRVAKVLPAEIPFFPFPGDALGVEAACQAFIATQDLSDLVVRVTLSDADGGTSAPLSSAVYQRVAAPRIGVETATIKPAVVCAMNTFWTTVRIPLTEFVGVDLGRLERLRIAVDPAENGNGQFTTLLDSVELLGHVLDPVCGNGALEAGEFCDGDDLGGSTCLTLGEGDGELACEAGCTFDVSDCILPGECQFDTPGCPGGPCLEVPDSTGVAAYFQDGRYCNDVTSVCREDNPGVWTCHDCSSMLDNRVGCPCLPNSLECPPGLGCFGTPPDLPGIDVGARGACWDELEGPPEGFCSDLCAASARICGSTVNQPTICLIPDCESDGYCELEPGVLVCDRDALPAAECVPACDEFSCEPGQICSNWGECWG